MSPLDVEALVAVLGSVTLAGAIYLLVTRVKLFELKATLEEDLANIYTPYELEKMLAEEQKLKKVDEES